MRWELRPIFCGRLGFWPMVDRVVLDWDVLNVDEGWFTSSRTQTECSPKAFLSGLKKLKINRNFVLPLSTLETFLKMDQTCITKSILFFNWSVPYPKSEQGCSKTHYDTDKQSIQIETFGNEVLFMKSSLADPKVTFPPSRFPTHGQPSSQVRCKNTVRFAAVSTSYAPYLRASRARSVFVLGTQKELFYMLGYRDLLCLVRLHRLGLSVGRGGS